MKVRVLWYGVNLDRLSLKSFEFSLSFKSDNLLNHMYKSIELSMDMVYKSMQCISIITSVGSCLYRIMLDKCKFSNKAILLVQSVCNIWFCCQKHYHKRPIIFKDTMKSTCKILRFLLGMNKDFLQKCYYSSIWSQHKSCIGNTKLAAGEKLGNCLTIGRQTVLFCAKFVQTLCQSSYIYSQLHIITFLAYVIFLLSFIHQPMEVV